jgi:hypothetical protein
LETGKRMHAFSRPSLFYWRFLFQGIIKESSPYHDGSVYNGVYAWCMVPVSLKEPAERQFHEALENMQIELLRVLEAEIFNRDDWNPHSPKNVELLALYDKARDMRTVAFGDFYVYDPDNDEDDEEEDNV